MKERIIWKPNKDANEALISLYPFEMATSSLTGLTTLTKACQL